MPDPTPSATTPTDTDGTWSERTEVLWSNRPPAHDLFTEERAS